MTDAEELYISDRLAVASDLATSGISLDMVQSIWLAYQDAKVQGVGTALGVQLVKLVSDYLEAHTEPKLISCMVHVVAIGKPSVVLDVRLAIEAATVKPHA